MRGRENDEMREFESMRKSGGVRKRKGREIFVGRKERGVMKNVKGRGR